MGENPTHFDHSFEDFASLRLPVRCVPSHYRLNLCEAYFSIVAHFSYKVKVVLAFGWLIDAMDL